MLPTFKKLHDLREAREDGFTLMEIIVVVMIMGVISAVAIPVFMSQRKNAVDDAIMADVKTIVSTVNSVRTSNPNAAYVVMRNGAICAGASSYPTTCPANAPKPQLIQRGAVYTVSGGGGTSGGNGEFYVSGYSTNANKYNSAVNKLVYSSLEEKFS